MEWYKIRAQANAAPEILIYDDIGSFGYSAKDFVEDVKALGEIEQLTLRINSAGGDVFDGIAIYNYLRSHPAQKTVYVDGVAASIASVIAMAGDRVIMPDNAFLMVHRAWGLVVGNESDMTEMAETMRRFDATISRIYQRRTNLPESEIKNLMAEETWLDAQQAVEKGFADEIAESVPLAARATFRAFNRLPEPLKQAPEKPLVTDEDLRHTNQPTDAEAIKAEAEKDTTTKVLEISRLCESFGIAELAPDFLRAGKTVAQVKEICMTVPDIRDLCTAARLPGRAVYYVKAGFSKSEVSKHLMDALMAVDPHEISGQHGPELRTNQPVIDYKEIYARYRTPGKKSSK